MLLRAATLTGCMNSNREKQDVFVKHNAPDNGQFLRWPRSQGQIP